MNIFTKMQLKKEFDELAEILEVYWERMKNYYHSNFPIRMFHVLSKQEKSEVMRFVNKHIISSKLSSRDWYLANCQWESDNWYTEIIFCKPETITVFTKMNEEFCSKFNRFTTICNELSISLQCTKFDGMKSMHYSIVKKLQTTIIITCK